jgi:polyhydroxybutyrate depolymerase
MKYLLTYLFLLIPVCLISQQTINGYIMHQNMKRDYILYVPASYTGNEAVPLVLNFHGYTSNATAQMGYGDFRPIADTANFIIVHPQGMMFNGNTHWNVGGWTVGSSADDVGFTAALLDTLAAHYNIDADRVYSTGMSNGGYMSFLLACQLSDKIAAIASVTGSMTPETFNACNPQHPTPIMQIHGTTDGTVPYNGAVWTKAIDDVMDYWIQFNSCDNTADTSAFPDINVLDGSTAEHHVFDNGNHEATAEHIKITGGGHTWPRTGPAGAGTNRDFDATMEIWKFFSRYDLNGLRGTNPIEDLSDDKSQGMIYPNPATKTLHINLNSSKNTAYQLFDLNGKLIQSGSIPGRAHVLDLSALAQGMYTLRLRNHGYRVLKAD